MLFFPSKETVGIPGFSFEIPEGWSVTHPDHVLFCVIHPQEVFSPNTVVALDRLSGDIAGDVIMGEMSEYVASLKNSHVTGQQSGVNDLGQEWSVIEYTCDDEIGPLASSLAVLTVRHDGVADVYRFHSTVAGEGAAEDLKKIHGFLSSIRIAEK